MSRAAGVWRRTESPARSNRRQGSMLYPSVIARFRRTIASDNRDALRNFEYASRASSGVVNP
jgi:hypothetical protein